MILIWLLACSEGETVATTPTPSGEAPAGELPDLPEEPGGDALVNAPVEPPPLGDNVTPDGPPPGAGEEAHPRAQELQDLLDAEAFDDADALVAQLRSSEPTDGRVASMTGLVLVARAHHAGFVEGEAFAEGADTWFLKAVELDRELASAWAALADWYELNNQPGSALGCYQELLALDPDDALIRARLGFTLAALDSKTEAAEQLRRALEGWTEQGPGGTPEDRAALTRAEVEAKLGELETP